MASGKVEPISKKVAEYNKIAVQSQKNMPENEVPKIWGQAQQRHHCDSSRQHMREHVSGSTSAVPPRRPLDF